MATQITQPATQTTHTNTGSASGLIPPPSLAEQDGGALVSAYIYTHTCTMWLPPAAGLRQSAQ